MKKFLLVFLFIIIFFMFGCNKSEIKIKIIVPNGIPSIAQSYLEYNQENYNYSIDRVTGPSPLIAAFTSGSHDIIIAPINIGANLYQKQSPYQLAGVLTWSNLQLISRTEILSVNDLSGKNISAYGEGAIPEMIIAYLFNNLNLEIPANISYQASSAQESLIKFMQNENMIAILSEPVTSSAKTIIDNLYVIDLGELWTEITNFAVFPQAGIFVHKELNKLVVNKYLDELSLSANYSLNEPKQTSEFCLELDYPYESSIIETAIPFSGIDYQSNSESKLIVETFLEMILTFKPELIGGSLPDEEFYWYPS